MAITLGSILGAGRVVVPLVGGVVRLIGGKKSARAEKFATVTEKILSSNPKKTTAGVVSAVTAAVLAILYAFWPEQAAVVVEWIKAISMASEAAG